MSTRSGHLVGLISEVPYDPWRPWQLLQTIRAQTLTALVEAALVSLADPEPVPEYAGSQRGLRWERGRRGRRLTVTDAGRLAGGTWLPLPLDLP
ncbi:hypothetical protein [Streptomyces anthocyanicus]|uniref:hypothetical protein n=1 Tax=Streptomyces anthocyanicus TaxID=68174 RepID=UPI0037FEF388